MQVGDLWIGLLKFYAVDFDVVNHVISLRQLKPMHRNEKKWISKRIAIEGNEERSLSKYLWTHKSTTFETQHKVSLTFGWFGLPNHPVTVTICRLVVCLYHFVQDRVLNVHTSYMTHICTGLLQHRENMEFGKGFFQTGKTHGTIKIKQGKIFGTQGCFLRIL